ncbi:MAG: type III-A CRISPR-associated protein Csm2 [Hydrogenobacter thermophilus]|uniref:type III-A CRISPR-associated protein Csm2 n=1 Tax=Hydrogenobacter thermophilus TaxID=940 RepID=UPI001C77803D|nr:type III-A CRISPR-associated protein Csm2 [Hydrogenobacter thermophilus]QWK20606.1 MAG: type III-A CRISPR-associated protein Csm2 [Hydrogenobacter thermophilus]
MKGNDAIREFTDLVKKNHLAGIDLASIVKPDGYAARIARNSGIKRTQLRKIFTEFKRVFDSYRKSKSFGEEELTSLYMLFPILEYQKNRRLLREDFVHMMEAVIESMINNPAEENVKRAEQFLTALVAYAKES